LSLGHGDALVLDDGRAAGIVAAEEELLDIRGRDAAHLAALAWHIGNRHLAAAIEASRILFQRDHVIKAMLEGVDAQVREVREPFGPLAGAYSGGHSHGHDGHGQGHAHGHRHGHDHHHRHAEPHAHGRQGTRHEHER
jgi:urease accessory protein